MRSSFLLSMALAGLAPGLNGCDPGVPEPRLTGTFIKVSGGKEVAFSSFTLDENYPATLRINTDVTANTYGRFAGPEWVAEASSGGPDAMRFNLTGGPAPGVGTRALSAEQGFDPGVAFNGEVEITVERLRPTGNFRSPVEVLGTMKTHPKVTSPSWKVDATFSISTDCANRGVFCGNFGTSGTTAVAYTEPREGDFSMPVEDGACPPEVQRVFIDGARWTYDAKSFRLGSATPLSCMQTSKRLAITCSASKENVEADGCRWTVDAFSDPFLSVWVFATANQGCARAGGRFCRTGYH